MPEAPEATAAPLDAPKPQKYFEDQMDNEEVLFVFHKHPIVMRKGLIFGMVAWLIGPLYTVVLTYTDKANPPGVTFLALSLVVSIFIGLLILAPSWISWHFSIFIITDLRFIQITQKGLWHRSVADLGLSQIQSVNYKVAGLQETLLGFGTIKMQTYVGDLVVHDVHHPARIQKQLLGILRAEGFNSGGYPGKPSPQSSKLHEETPET